MQVFPLREMPEQYRILGVDVFPQEGNVVLGLTFVVEKEQVECGKGARSAKPQALKGTMPPGQFHIYVFSASYLRAQACFFSPENLLFLPPIVPPPLLARLTGGFVAGSMKSPPCCY